jgi:hypothetical protein
VTYQKRLFVGHKSACDVNKAKISADSLDEILDQMWNEAIKYDLMEVFVSNEKFHGVEKRKPTIEEIDKFLIIQDKTGKRCHDPTELKGALLKTFQNKKVNVLIHVYSTNVSSQKIYNNIKHDIEQIEGKKGSGAEVLINMTDRIKKFSSNVVPVDFLSIPKCTAEEKTEAEKNTDI